MLLNSKKVDIGMTPTDFELKNVDNKIYTLNSIKKKKWICYCLHMQPLSLFKRYNY